MIFTDYLASNNETAEKEIMEGIEKICKSQNDDCSVEINNNSFGCQFSAISQESSKTMNNCWIIPSDKLLFLKVYSINAPTSGP